MPKRGQPALGNTVELRVAINPELDAGLDALAALSGISKATACRFSIMMTLSVVGLLPAEAPADLPLTKTRNRRNR